jgi:hypothetical protein
LTINSNGSGDFLKKLAGESEYQHGAELHRKRLKEEST